jgi:hypothetical protein
MFIRVLQNDPNWHTLDCLPVPYAIDRKKLATTGGRSPPRFNAGWGHARAAQRRRPFAGLRRIAGESIRSGRVGAGQSQMING